MAKTYNTTSIFTYFNNRPIKKDPQDMIETIEKVAMKSLESYSYEKWHTILEYEKNLTNAWDYAHNNYYFKRWWLDKLVYNWGIVIWNTVWKQVRTQKDDKAASRAADDAEINFLKNFL